MRLPSIHALAAVAALIGVAPTSPGQARSTGAGDPAVEIVSSGAISDPVSTTEHVEPWLAVDPADPERLVAAAMLVGPEESGSAVWSSSDGGLTWANGGDTQGLVALPGGDFLAAWIHAPRESLQLWHARLRAVARRP